MHFWIDEWSEGCSFNVRRFQVSECVAHSGIRHSRGSSYISRGSAYCHPSIHYNRSGCNIRLPRCADLSAPVYSPTSRRNIPPTPKLKCCVWIFFALISSLLVFAKYYFYGFHVGIEGVLFCSLLIIAFIIFGLMSSCESIAPHSPASNHLENPILHVPEQQEQEIQHVPVSSTASQSSVEMPPPPYHIAVLLPPQNNLDAVQVVPDSPPPSYEKAVT